MVFFLSSSMILGLLDQLKIFSQLHLIELLGLLTGLWLLNISKVFDRDWHASLLHKLKSYGISGQIFSHISFFLNNRRLWMVLDKSLHKNFQLMLEILKAPFLVLHFSYYTLIIFLMILSVILLSLNLNLIYKTLWTGVRNDLLISILGKLCYFHLTSLTKMVLLMWKWMSLLLRKNHLLRCWGWPSLLN